MNDYLEHYGIKGMKWGVRRTAEQLGHKIKKAVSGKPRSDGVETSKRKKRVSEMTDEELTSHLKRMRMEDEYSRLASQQSERTKSKVGNFIKKHAGDMANQLASRAVTQFVAKVFEKKEEAFDASKFDFDDTSKISIEKLLEANKWFQAETRYKDLSQKYSEGRAREEAEQAAKALMQKYKIDPDGKGEEWLY